MNDDWRLQIDLDDEGLAGSLMEHLDARELEHDLSDAFQDRVIVSRDGAQVFLYTGTRDQAESARGVVVSLAQEHNWTVNPKLKHWHPAAEEWEDPDAAVEGDAAEHEELIATEHEETEERGHPEFEVRVDLPSRHEAERFAQRLQAEGLPAVRRAKYLLVGAADEDAAKVLAERIKGEAPPGSEVRAEGTWQAAYAERPANPFAIFGGLGG
ncbi:MAG TPA: hypothetical protein VII45_12660 [Solirubrobacterales bacterium]